MTATERWEARRFTRLEWTQVDEATGYAIYVDGKLFATTPWVARYNLPAYAFANKTNADGQPTTVGAHNIKMVALFDEEAAPETIEETNSKHLIGSHDFTLYVNYIYGSQTDIWNKSNIDNVWNFTVCESAREGNINRGARVLTTYQDDGSVQLTIKDVGEHAGRDQAWTIKASLYDQPSKNGEDYRLTFDIIGPAALVGRQLEIKWVPEEVGEDNQYMNKVYEEVIYKFEDDGNGKAIIHFDESHRMSNDTYDLFFGLGLLDLNLQDADLDLTLTDPTMTTLYSVTEVNPSAIPNKDDINNSGIYVGFETEVPDILSDQYRYEVYIDGELAKLPDGEDTYRSGLTYQGYGPGSHDIEVRSYLIDNNGPDEETGSVTGSVTIENTNGPDLIVTDISIPRNTEGDGSWHEGETVPVTVTVQNIGTEDAVYEGSTVGHSLCVWLYSRNPNRVDGQPDRGINYALLTDQKLAAGASTTVTINYEIQPGDNRGEHMFTLRAVADSDNVITEINEANNAYAESFKFVAALEEVTLVNNGTNIVASWPVHDETTLRYGLNYIDATTGERTTQRSTTRNATTMTLPAGTLIENNTEVWVYAYHSDGSSHLYAIGRAMADLAIEEVKLTTDTAILNRDNPVVVTVKNVGVAQATGLNKSQEFAVKTVFTDGEGKYVTQTDKALAPNETLEMTIPDGIPASQCTVEGDDYSVWVNVDDASDGDGAGKIYESDDAQGTDQTRNNFKQLSYQVKQIKQQKMDWTPLYTPATRENYPFKVANGTQKVTIEYKVLDTSYTDIDYKDIFQEYSGYNDSYMAMNLIDDGNHNLIKTEDLVPSGWGSRTKTDFAQVTRRFCDNYKTGDEPENFITLASKSCNILDATGEIKIPTNSDSSLEYVYGGNKFNFSVNAWTQGKYYALRIRNQEDDNYVIVAFRVLGEDGEWVKARATDAGGDSAIPMPYHEKNNACMTKGSLYYDVSDLGLAVMSVYNGQWLVLTTDTMKPVYDDNYKIEIAYAGLDDDGKFLVPEDDFVEVDPNSRREDMHKIHIQIPELLRQLPLHSGKGGETDDVFYFMKVYPDKTKTDDYISVPIMVRAAIPMIQETKNIKASIIPNDEDQNMLRVSWTETTQQAAYDYHYDIEVYENEDAYNSGTPSFKKENVTDLSHTFDATSLGTNIVVKVVTKWCDQTVATKVTAVQEYMEGWREISGDSRINVHAGQKAPIAVLGTISFYEDIRTNHAYDVEGYNGMYISISGNKSYYGEDAAGSGGAASTSEAYLSKGVNNEDDLNSMTDTDAEYKSVDIYEQTEGQLQINTQNEFSVSYKTTYYNLKVEKDGHVAVIKIKVEVTPGKAETKGFQMNTNYSEGGVSEFMPSFRVVSRAPKLIAEDDSPNPKVSAVTHFGTLYGLKSQIEENDMTITYGSTGEGVSGTSANTYYVEADEAGVLSNWPQSASDADSSAYSYYAVTFKSLSYNYDMLDTEYCVKTYAVTEEGNVVYEETPAAGGNAVKTAKIYDIADTLYEKSMMTTKESHEYLYNNVLNIVDLYKNRNDIMIAMLRAMNVPSGNKDNDEFRYANTFYSDVYYYTHFTNVYKEGSYADRGEFTSRTMVGEVENEKLLLGKLNAIEGNEKTYKGTAEWIQEKVVDKGFHKVITYSPENADGAVDGAKE